MLRDIEKIRVRFNASIVKSEGCWTWVGYINKGGYGKIYFRDKLESAHRISFMLDRGLEDLPKSCVLHSCDNTKCVRPDHLFSGTQLDNIDDMNRKGRHWNSQKTHCKNGHPFSGENLVIQANGQRSCRICLKDYFDKKIRKTQRKREKQN